MNSNITDLVPKLIIEISPQNVKEAVNNTLLSIREFRSGTRKDPNEIQFLTTGFSETDVSYLQQMEKGSTEIDDILNHMGFHFHGNLTTPRHIDKIIHTMGNENRLRCLFLMTTSSICFAQTHYQEDYQIRRILCTSKNSSQSDCQPEKKHTCQAV